MNILSLWENKRLNKPFSTQLHTKTRQDDKCHRRPTLLGSAFHMWKTNQLFIQAKSTCLKMKMDAGLRHLEQKKKRQKEIFPVDAFLCYATFNNSQKSLSNSFLLMKFTLTCKYQAFSFYLVNHSHRKYEMNYFSKPPREYECC